MALNARCSIAVFAALAIFSTFSASHAWNIGGKTPVDVNDPAVNKAAQFAVSELNKRNGKSQVSLREVVSAQRQIVAGMNYILVIKLVEAGQEVLHRATVYDQFGKLSMTKDEVLNTKPVKKYTQSAVDSLSGKKASGKGSNAGGSAPTNSNNNEATARAYMSRLGRGSSRLVSRIISKPAKCKRKAANGDKLSIHYIGKLSSNGKKFDSSYDRDEPFTFTLGQGQVIKGWEEGVPGMCVGEKRRLLIPSTLGYGSRGFGSVIPPNAALDFTVTLVDIVS
eukprot:g9846.t1